MARAKLSAYGLATSLVGASIPILQGGANKVAPSGLFMPSGVQSTEITAPVSTGDESSIDTAFDGDWSKSILPIEHRVSGEETAGKPSSGYTSRPEIMPVYINSLNSSGWNESTSGNDGRTGIAQVRLRFKHDGLGDFYGVWVSGSVSGVKPGATSFLANGAAAIIGGNLSAVANGAYLNPLEFLLKDHGFDAAAIGPVINMERTNDTGAINALWMGMRVQSIGTKEINAAYYASGKAKVGLDLSSLDLSASGQAAITLLKDQRIYGNVALDSNPVKRNPTLSNDYLGYADTISGWLFVVNNNSILQVVNQQVTVNGSTGLVLASTGVLKYAGIGSHGQYGTGAQTPAFSATNKPGATSGAGPAAWMKVNLGGTDYYVPAWAA